MLEKILCAVAAAALFVVVGTIAFNEFNQDQVVVVVDLKPGEDPFNAIRQIVPSDSTVTEVKEVNRSRNEYQLTVKTKRQRAGLLEWLRSSSRVERVEEKQP